MGFLPIPCLARGLRSAYCAAFIFPFIVRSARLSRAELPTENRDMSSAPSEIALLQKIVSNLRVESLKQGPFGQNDLHALGMFVGKIGPAGIAGIRVEAAEAVGQLADAIFTGSPYQRGTTFAAVTRKLTDTIILHYANQAKPAVDAKAVAFVRKQIDDWFQEQIASHEFYIPCLISPYPAASFSIGPIRFAHVQDFVPEAKHVAAGVFDLTFGPVFELMQRAAAHWVAIVEVAGCTRDRAQEIANLAVDVALAGLQLCLPESKNMSRMTGRAMPVFSQVVSRSDGQLTGGGSNTGPGFAFGPGFLDQRLKDAKPLLDSVGNRVAAYIRGGAGMTGLEQAWPDAAYWYHEGTAEPLDTIAVPKLETAIEILLQAESTSGSKVRVLKAIRAFYGKEPNDVINPESQTTVEQLAKGLVRDRSRILHGTWSTLNHPLHASRPSLTGLARDVLAIYTMELDQYLASASPSDDVEKFLDFVERRQQAVAAAENPTDTVAAPSASG